MILRSDLSYDYDALRLALGAVGIWSLLVALSARSLIDLRNRAGHLRFRDAFDAIAGGTSQVDEIRRVFTLAAEARNPTKSFLSVVQKRPSSIGLKRGIVVGEPEIDALAERLDMVSETAMEIAFSGPSRSQSAPRRRRIVGNTRQKDIAVFVALEEERRLLIDLWSLASEGMEQVWRGTLNGSRVSLFSRDELGRVPAAVATMEYLFREKPDVLIVAGIAGGFPHEKVHLGDVLIATSIVDLASRKIHTDDRTIPEFRPRVFQTDERFAKYLKTCIDTSEWETQVIKAAEWPASRRPAIRYGPLVSLDEVVASSDYAEALSKYWPKLLGIEMEAGGVCAAADAFDIRAAVIRGVSDLADLSKSDNEWRRRAMKTVANLIGKIDFNVLLY
jgi:nucleoside phosphorylase